MSKIFNILLIILCIISMIISFSSLFVAVSQFPRKLDYGFEIGLKFISTIIGIIFAQFSVYLIDLINKN